MPPSQPNEDASRTRMSALPSRASLDVSYFNASQVSHDNPDGESGVVNPDRYSLSELRPSSASAMSRLPSSRGQFGGVTFGVVSSSSSSDSGNNSTDKLGKCILASYSDRKHSGVVVWSELFWTSSCQQFIKEVDDDTTSSNTVITTHHSDIPTSSSGSGGNRLTTLDASIHTHTTCAIYCPLNRSRFLFKPYLIEVDPSFRRLAGLVPLSNCRDVIVVDQGAQNISRIHYA
ncbi:unnamed protein product [Trichobilharzia regenti]|nr:unnamed protein product [Trichobilharzia regenti]